MLKGKYKLSEENYNTLQKALSNCDINDFLFYITPYHEETDYYKWQIGATSHKANLKGEFDNNCIDYEFNELVEFVCPTRFKIMIEIPKCAVCDNSDDDDCFCYAEPIRMTIGYMYGYLINSFEMVEDMDGRDRALFAMDGHSQILSDVWCIFKELAFDYEYKRYFKDVDIPEHHTFLLTNVNTVKELYSPELEDLILHKLVPDYFDSIGKPIYTAMRTFFQTEFEDDFDANDSDFVKNYDYNKHIDTLINNLGYKQVELDCGKIPYLLREVNYGFMNIDSISF